LPLVRGFGININSWWVSVVGKTLARRSPGRGAFFAEKLDDPETDTVGEEHAMSLGIYLYLTTTVLAGNFILSTMCSPFCSPRQRNVLRSLFALGLVGVTSLGYSLYGADLMH
jgi:hypothetical protein